MRIITILIIVNYVFWLIIGWYFSDEIYMLKIFNKRKKIYLKLSIDKLKEIKENLIRKGEDDSYITFKRNSVFVLYQGYKFRKDNTIILPNIRGRLIEQGIIIPIYLIICSLPLIIHLIPMRNIMLLVLLFTYVVWFYNNFFMYLKMKLSKIEDLNENNFYKHNYITYIIHYNKVFVIDAALAIFGYLPTHANITLIIIIIVLIRMHLNLFIDKIDKILPWDVLEKRNMDIRNQIDYIFSLLILSVTMACLSYYPLIFTF